jgi:hypothetical protein
MGSALGDSITILGKAAGHTNSILGIFMMPKVVNFGDYRSFYCPYFMFLTNSPRNYMVQSLSSVAANIQPLKKFPLYRRIHKLQAFGSHSIPP